MMRSSARIGPEAACRRLHVRWLLSLLLCVSATACARKAPSFPSGTGSPFPEFASAYEQATASCRAVTSMTASMALSGKAAKTKLRGRIDAGFAAPAKMRLEGRAPFGRPVFVLTADGDRATLVLPRDERVLANAPPDRIVEALAGVPLSPETLRIAVAGCALSTGAPTDGRIYSGGRASVTLGSETVYLRRVGSSWQLVGAARQPIAVSYDVFVNGRPTTIRLRSTASNGVSSDITLRLSQVEINGPLDARTFQVDVPARATPLTLEELRRAGPLGDGAKGEE